MKIIINGKTVILRKVILFKFVFENCSVMLRSISVFIIVDILTSSPVFCPAKYRGGVRKDGGVNLYRKKLMKPFQPLSSETTVPSVSPLYR